MQEIDSETVIWYRPRVRIWRDKQGELHLAGEPDGLTRVLDAFRIVARGIEDQTTVSLRIDAIPRDRNPVGARGVKQLFETLSFRRDRAATELRVTADGNAVTIHFSDFVKSSLGFSIVEAIDGEGDYSLAISYNETPSRLWFWGYSNPHGVDSF